MSKTDQEKYEQRLARFREKYVIMAEKDKDDDENEIWEENALMAVGVIRSHHPDCIARGNSESSALDLLELSTESDPVIAEGTRFWKEKKK